MKVDRFEVIIKRSQSVLGNIIFFLNLKSNCKYIISKVHVENHFCVDLNVAQNNQKPVWVFLIYLFCFKAFIIFSSSIFIILICSIIYFFPFLIYIYIQLITSTNTRQSKLQTISNYPWNLSFFLRSDFWRFCFVVATLTCNFYS